MIVTDRFAIIRRRLLLTISSMRFGSVSIVGDFIVMTFLRRRVQCCIFAAGLPLDLSLYFTTGFTAGLTVRYVIATVLSQTG